MACFHHTCMQRKANICFILHLHVWHYLAPGSIERVAIWPVTWKKLHVPDLIQQQIDFDKLFNFRNPSHHTGQASPATCRLTHFHFPFLTSSQRRPSSFSLKMGQLLVSAMRHENVSNNCRVGKINERRSSLVRSHHAIFVFSSSLHPTKDENRMVCAGL